MYKRQVDDKSLRDEEYYDLQIPVKGCPTLFAGFDEYVKEELLDGENQYHSDRYGKQDAKKGALTESLPHPSPQPDPNPKPSPNLSPIPALTLALTLILTLILPSIPT